MTQEEKIKVIESMGIDWKTWCPFHIDYKFGEFQDYDCVKNNFDCKACWIKALEE